MQKKHSLKKPEIFNNKIYIFILFNFKFYNLQK